MKYYKDNTTGEVFAFEEDGSQDVLIKPEYKRMTASEIEVHLKPALPSKEEKLSKITVTTQSGITFDGNEAARTNIMGALKVAEITGQTSTMWKVANNDKVLVTIQDLEEALTLAMIAVGRTVGAIE